MADPTITWDAPKTQAAPPPTQSPAAPATAGITWDAPKAPTAAPRSPDVKWDSAPAASAENPGGLSPHLPGKLLPNVQTALDAQSSKYGMDPWMLRAIARLESGGMAHPETAASPAGAQGVMQIMPATFKGLSKGNIVSLNDNIEAGARYFHGLLQKYGDPVKAAGAYNAGPGAFDEYLKTGKGLTHETEQYMANVAAMHTPIDRPPLPPVVQNQLPTSALHGPVQTAYIQKNLPEKRQPGQQKANLDPKKAAYEWYDQVFGATDAGYIMANAGMADVSMATGAKGGPTSSYMRDAMHLYMKNPAAASAEYGPNSRNMLILQSEIGDDKIAAYPQLAFVRANARAMLANPALAGGETAIEEFFNPMAWGQGELAGRLLGWTGKAVQGSVIGRYVTHLASPFKGIVARHGENARNLLAQVGARVKQADAPAEDIRHNVYDGLTHAEQWEVRRLTQPTHKLRPEFKDKAGDLQRRAAILRAAYKKVSAEKIKAKVLTPSQVKDVDSFVPMRGAYANQHPTYNAETMSFLDELRPGIGKGTPAAESLHHAKYDTIDAAEGAGAFSAADVSAATLDYKFFKSSYQNIAWEDGQRALAAKHPDMIRFDSWENYKGMKAKPWAQNAFDDEAATLTKVIEENHAKYPVGHPERLVRTAPRDKYDREMVNLPEAGIHTSSPALQNAWVSREYAAFLGHGKRGGAAGATLSGVSTNELFDMENIVQKINKAQRAMIFSGPSGLIYHQFNNLAPNAAAATKAGIAETARNYGRALVGAAFSVGDFAKMIPGPVGGASKAVLEGLEQRFFVGSNLYAEGLAKAIAAGADAHFGPGMKSALGADAIRLKTIAESDLKPMEKFDKFVTALADWQTHAVFGERGEGQFVSELYKHFTEKMGMEPEDAAWQTRAALGPYQDMNPDSLPAKLMLFYAWMKGNGAHWVLNFAANPKLPRAQVEAFHRYNEEAGDPRANDPLHRRNPSQLYAKDAEGRDVSQTEPFPWRIAEQIGNVVTPEFMNHASFNDRLQSAAQLVTSRLKASIAVPFDEIATLANQKANPQGTFTGLTESAYDKNEPGREQAREAAISAIKRSGLYPSPMLVQDIADNGYDQTRLMDYMKELVGAGTVTRSESSVVKKQFKRFAAQETSELGRLWKRMQSSNPYSPDEFEARRKFIVDRYNTKVQRKKEALLVEQKKKNTQSGVKWDSTPSPSAITWDK